MANDWLQQRNAFKKSIQPQLFLYETLSIWMYLRGLPICNDIMVMSGWYTGYKCMLSTHTHMWEVCLWSHTAAYTHTHTLSQRELFFWQWIRGCCLEALLNHNDISNPLSLVCTSVWSLSLLMALSGVNEVPEAMNWEESKTRCKNRKNI